MEVRTELIVMPQESWGETSKVKARKFQFEGQGFLIDMDGVLYRGPEVIHGAKEFILMLQNLDIPHLFLTNNSKPTPRDISLNLRNKLSVYVDPENIYTSAMATAEFLSRETPGASVFVIGEGGLLNAVAEAGFAISESRPDYVVLGEGRTLTIEMVEKAIDFIIAGAKFIVTNLDPSPRMRGWPKPGTAAVAAMIQEATGIKPLSCGKPSPILMRSARKRLGLRTQQMTVIGDTMETDIFGGMSMGYQTVLTLSGATKKEGLGRYPYSPHLIVNDISEFTALMQEATHG